MRTLLLLQLLAAILTSAWSADAAPDAPAQGAAAAAPAAKPLPDSVEPELAKQAFEAMDETRKAVDGGKITGATAAKPTDPRADPVDVAVKKFRRLQRECLVEFFSVEARRKPLPESMGKDATDFNESIDGDWQDARSTLPQRAGYAYGHAKKIEWLMELCDGAPHRYGNKNRDELDAERKARDAGQPAPKPNKKP